MRRIDKSKKNNQKKISRKTRIMRVMRGGVRKNFGPINDWDDSRRRWFTLDDRTLYYYSDEKRQKLINIIELDSSPTKMYVSGENFKDYVVIKQNSTDENSQMLKLSSSTYREKQELEKLFNALPGTIVDPPEPPEQPEPTESTNFQSKFSSWWKSRTKPSSSDESSPGDRSEPEFDPDNPYKFLKEVLKLPEEASEETISTKIKEKFDATRSVEEWNTLAERLNLINLSEDVLINIKQDKTYKFLKLREDVDLKKAINLTVEHAESIEALRREIVKQVILSVQQDENSNSTWNEIKKELREKTEKLVSQAKQREEAKNPPKRKDNRTAHQILGVSDPATRSDIIKAYKAKALEHHPDKLRTKLGREPTEKEKEEAEEEFKKVTNAYDTLKRWGGKRKSHKKRKIYRKHRTRKRHRTRKHRKPKSHKKRKSRSRKKRKSRMGRSPHKTRR